MISSGELNLITSQWIRDAFSKLLDQRDFLLEVNQSNHNLQILKSDEFYKHVRYDIKNGELVSSSITPIYDFDALAADESFINMISRQSLSWKGILWQFKSYNSDVLQIRDSINAELQKLNNR